MPERIHWIDTCKGILICLVIMSHISDIGCMMSINMPVLFRFGGITLLWKSFYMPLFFMLNAYITDYNVDLKFFVVKRFKSLMIPAFIFSIIVTIVDSMVLGNGSYVQSLSSISIYLRFGAYWFLPALFGSNVIFAILYKYVIVKLHPSILIEVIVFAAISLLGIILSFCYGNDPFRSNVLYYRHVLFYVVFIYVGFKAKNVQIAKPVYIVFSLLYFAAAFLCVFFDISMPQFNGWISYSLYSIPLLYFLAFSGSIMLVGFSKLVNNLKMVEYIGRNTLVIYLVHSSIIIMLFKFVAVNWQTVAVSYQVLFLVGVFLVTLCTSLLINYILSMRYVRVMIGKF